MEIAKLIFSHRGVDRIAVLKFAMDFDRLEMFKEILCFKSMHSELPLDSLLDLFTNQTLKEKKEFFKTAAEVGCFKQVSPWAIENFVVRLCQIDDVEFLAITIRYINDKQNDFFSIELQTMMSHLMKNTQIHDGITAVRFAFIRCFDEELKILIDEREWTDQEIFQFLMETKFVSQDYSPLSSPLKCLDLILNKLSKQAKIEYQHVQCLLEIYIRRKIFQECFLRIWNDDRFLKSSDLAAQWLSKSNTNNCLKIVNFLLPKCSLNYLVQFEITDQRKWQPRDDDVETEIELVKMDLKTKCWLDAILENEAELISSIDRDLISITLELFEIEMSQELFDLSMKVAFLNDASNSFYQLLTFPNFHQFWNAHNQHLALVCACSVGSVTLFKLLLKRFPKIDLSVNNNEALITLMNSSLFNQEIFNKFRERKLTFKPEMGFE